MTFRKPANDNAPNDRPAFLSIRQIAQRWQVDEKTVRRLVWRGELTVHRFGAQLRIGVPDLVGYERLNRLGEVA